MDKKFYVPNIKLDKIDRHILSLLHENSRISYTDIGKEIGISRVAVQTRVNTLLKMA